MRDAHGYVPVERMPESIVRITYIKREPFSSRRLLFLLLFLSFPRCEARDHGGISNLTGRRARTGGPRTIRSVLSLA